MIETIREIVQESPGITIGIWGLVIGLILGFVVNRTNYCAMGAISDIDSFRDYRRFRAWMLAAATAMVGAWFAQSMGIADISSSIYLSTNLNIAGAVVGGLMFGYGMVFSGGCVTKNIVRAGSGDMRSAINLIIVGIFAYMTIGGILGLVRTNTVGQLTIDLSEIDLETQSIGSMVSLFTGGNVESTNMMAMIVIAGGIAIWCFKDKAFRSSPNHYLSGIILGLLVIAGWFLTGLASDDLADVVVPVGSISFVRPTGDALEYLMRYTALGAPSFGIVVLLGTILGSTLTAFSNSRFKLTGFANVEDTMRNLYGAALMGIGGVLALGCTFGQGITGISTLAVGSFVALGAIVTGGFLGIRHLNAILMAED